MGCLVGEMSIPDESVHIASESCVIRVETIGRLIFGSCLYLHGIKGQGMFGMQYHHSCDGIAAIHE